MEQSWRGIPGQSQLESNPGEADLDGANLNAANLSKPRGAN